MMMSKDGWLIKDNCFPPWLLANNCSHRMVNRTGTGKLKPESKDSFLVAFRQNKSLLDWDCWFDLAMQASAWLVNGLGSIPSGR